MNRSLVKSALLIVVMLLGGATASSRFQLFQTPNSNDTDATIAAMDDRVSKLETRVSILENTLGQQPSSQVATKPPAAHTLSGTYAIKFEGGQERTAEGVQCAEGESSQIRAGTQIKVFDGSGKLIATTRLQPGLTKYETFVDKYGNRLYLTMCVLTFDFDNLPDSDFYELSIEGTSNTLTLSREELDSQDWQLHLE